MHRRTLPFALLVLGALAGGARALPQAPGIAGLYEPGEETHWVFEQRGQTIGHCSSRYGGPTLLGGVGCHRFESWVHLELETGGTRFEQDMYGELWIQEDGSPLVYSFHSQVADVYGGVDLTFAEKDVTARVQEGVVAKTLELSADEGSLLLTNNFISQLELILACKAPGAGETVETRIFSANALQSLPLELRHVGEFVDREHGGGSVLEDSFGETLRWSHTGRLLSVEIATQGLLLRRDEGPFENTTLTRPALAQRPKDLHAEEVVIEHGEVSLAGTVTRPKDADGALPAVLFLSGSGPQDRDGYSSGIDVGTHEILDHLTRSGFLVLRFDDRGVGASTGPTDGMTFDDIVADARACVRFLRAREDVDPTRLALIGHSEGGQVAPVVAQAEEGLAALVLLAAPGRNLQTITREQFLAAKALEGAEEDELEAYGASIDAFLEDVNSGAELVPASLPGELAMLVPARAWLASHAALEPARVIRSVTCPVLLLQGATDIQVSPERDAKVLEAALAAADHGDHELVVFPGLDHLFKRTPGATPSGLDYLKVRRVDDSVLEKLASWLGERLGSPR